MLTTPPPQCTFFFLTFLLVLIYAGLSADASSIAVSQVKFATENQIPILAQTGGHGFSTSLLGLSGDASIVINLRAMNDVSFDLAAGTAILGAGVLTGEALLAAEKAKAHM